MNTRSELNDILAWKTEELRTRFGSELANAMIRRWRDCRPRGGLLQRGDGSPERKIVTVHQFVRIPDVTEPCNHEDDGNAQPEERSDDYELNLAAHPHDAFFKEVFSSPEHAAAFFQGHLPPEVARVCLWQTLALVPGSFVKRSLQQAHCDLLFSVQMPQAQEKETGESRTRELMLYLLFEHQTSVDPAMPLRILAYMVEILLTRHEQGGLPLPPVIGYVLHQGPERWKVSQRFEDLFDLPQDSRTLASLLPFIPKFQHGLLDLSGSDPAREEEHDRVRVFLQLMKLAREKRLLEFFEWLLHLSRHSLSELPDGLLKTLLLYALHADSNLDIDSIARTITANKRLEDLTMSVAEQLRAEGKAEGLRIGQIQLLERLIGREQTPSEALSDLSLEQLEQRFEALQREYDDGVKGKPGLG